MVKNTNTNKNNYVKIITKRALIGIGIIIAVWILAVVGDYATRPIRNGWERDKYVGLDSRMEGLYQQLVTASKGAENWNYDKECEEELSGAFPTGRYLCSAILSTEKIVTDVDEVNDLQTKYYPVIDGSPLLEPVTDLDPQYPNDFGKRFVVSGASKSYREKETQIECEYLLRLNQTVNLPDRDTLLYGLPITNNEGSAMIRLNCSGITSGDWFN